MTSIRIILNDIKNNSQVFCHFRVVCLSSLYTFDTNESLNIIFIACSYLHEPCKRKSKSTGG